MAAQPRPHALRTSGWAEHPLVWAALAVVGAAAIGYMAQEDTRLLLDAGLVVAAVAVFTRWTWLALLVVLAVVWKDNLTLEIATLIGGGVAVLIAGRGAFRAPAAAALLLLVLIAVPRLPIAPGYFDSIGDPQHYLPFVHIAYFDEPSNAFTAWLRLGFLLVVLCLGIWLVRDRARIGWVLAAALGGASFPVAKGLVQLITGDTVHRVGSDARAIEGPFTHPNAFAFYLIGVLVIGLVVLIETRDRLRRIALAVLVAAGSVCLFATYTRSAWIGFVAAIIVLGVLRYRWLLVVGLAAGIALIVIFPGAAQTIDRRFGDLSKSSTSYDRNSYGWRQGEWSRMVHWGTDAPLTGTGFGTYAQTTVREFGYQDGKYSTVADPKHPGKPGVKGFSAHNDYVRMLVELGFPGLVLWSIVLLGVTLSALWAARIEALRPIAIAVVAVMLALIGISYADNVQGYGVPLVIPFVLAGGLATTARRMASGSTTRASAPAPAGGSTGSAPAAPPG
jgi:O-antigen ligase